MTLTILDGILALVPNTEGSVNIQDTTMAEVHALLTENRGFKLQNDSHGNPCYTKEPVGFEDWLTLKIEDGYIKVSWGHW